MVQAAFGDHGLTRDLILVPNFAIASSAIVVVPKLSSNSW